MRRRLRRAAAFLLVPLSALPLVAVAPVVAPSAERRLDELRGVPERQTAPAAPATTTTTRTTPATRTIPAARTEPTNR